MKTHLKRSVIVMALSIALLGLSSPSFAGGYHRAVNYSDLNLDQPGDVAVMYERIQDAAKTVCRLDKSSWDGRVITHYRKCIQTVVDKAVHDVNHDTLTALHQGQNESAAKR
jgi:UrcA family protein